MRERWFATRAVSDRMKRIKSAGTKLELIMRKLLRSAGIKFRFQPHVFGRPDFRIVGTKVLVFCDSSFWHGRCARPNEFSRNRRLWREKFRNNIRRDRLVNRVLRRRGWVVLRFWDSEIMRSPEKVLGLIRRTIRGKGRGI